MISRGLDISRAESRGESLNFFVANKISLGFSIIFFHSTRKRERYRGTFKFWRESGSIWSHTVLCFQTSAGTTPSPCECRLFSRMICEEYCSDYHEFKTLPFLQDRSQHLFDFTIWTFAVNGRWRSLWSIKASYVMRLLAS